MILKPPITYQKKQIGKLFFDWIVSNSTNDECYRLRTYWYVTESCDFYPFGFGKKDQTARKKIFSQHKPFNERLLASTNLQLTLEEIEKELKETQQSFLNRFHGWKHIQDSISSTHRAIEFRRSGAISYNLFDRKLGKEKTVDVKLALDTLIFEQNYDVAIIVSGDQDYVPAAQILKDKGKTVINVSFNDEKGGFLPGGAKRLNMATDKMLQVPFDTLIGNMGCASSKATKS